MKRSKKLQMNRIIKLKTFQEKAVFRTPYSMEIIETYPLPPYSTVLGFIHDMLSSSQTIDGINISVQGKYGNLCREFVRYHKYKAEETEGKPYPIIVTFLVDLELIIHIKMPSAELHNKLLASLLDPPYFPYLGRPEDLIINMEVNEDEELELDLSTTEGGEIKLPYNSYIRFDMAETFEIEGIPYMLPAYYKLVSKPKYKSKRGRRKRENLEIFRNFEMIKVIYAQAEQGITERQIRIINTDKEGIPIWWIK